MKKILNNLLIFAAIGIIFTACNNDNDSFDPSANIPGFYFCNYGTSGVPSTITKYDEENDSVTNSYYYEQNGFKLTSNVQYMYEYNDNIYMMGNDADQIIVTDLTFEKITTVSTDIATPRYCVAKDNYLYISCWGESLDYEKMANSYIAKFNVSSNTVEKTIPVAGGPEGLAIANGKLYAALNYVDSVAVVDLDDNAVSYIVTPAVASYFVEDGSDNLYVALVSTYSDPSTTTGLGYINTSTNTLDTTYELSGVSSGYASILAPNSDCSIIYVLASSYVKIDGEWTQKGAIYSFDTSDKTYSSFLENLTGINGMFVDPTSNDGKIFVFGGESYKEPGTVVSYTTSATKVKEFDCGISPYWAFYLDNE